MLPRLPERRLLLSCLAMIGTAGAAQALKPSRFLADELPPVVLDEWFPRAFGEWETDPDAGLNIRSPDLQEKLDQIYNKTLDRVYVNRNLRRRVMLSVAYGGDQSDAMSAHLPEVCYPAQGFEVKLRAPGALQNGERQIPVVRLSTRLRERQEQVMYWVAIAGQPTRSRLDQKLAQMRLGLRGLIPDGVLFRVSEINPSSQSAFALLDDFSRSLLSSMPESGLNRIASVN